MYFEQSTADANDLTQSTFPSNASFDYDDFLQATSDSDVPPLVHGGPSPSLDPVPSTPSELSLTLRQLPGPSVEPASGSNDLALFATGQRPPPLPEFPPLSSPPPIAGGYSPSPLDQKHDDSVPQQNLDGEPSPEADVSSSLTWVDPPAPEMPTFPGAMHPRTRRQRGPRKQRSITGSVQPPLPPPLSPAAAGPSRLTEPAFHRLPLCSPSYNAPPPMASVVEDATVQGGLGLVPYDHDGFQAGTMQAEPAVLPPDLFTRLGQLEWNGCTLPGGPVLDLDPYFYQPPFAYPDPSLLLPPPPPPPPPPAGPFSEFAPPPPDLLAFPPPSPRGLTPLGEIDAPDASPEFLRQVLLRRMDELEKPDAANSEEDAALLNRCLTLAPHRQMIASLGPLLPQHEGQQNVPGGSKTRKRARRGCFRCSKSFASSQRLMTHLGTHLKTNKVICPECGTALKGDLPRHFRLVHKKCHKCGGPVAKDGTSDHTCARRKRR